MRGEGLRRKIPFMADFLIREARRLLAESAGLEALVLEAGLLKHVASHLWEENDLLYLDVKVLVQQCGSELNLTVYAGGGVRQLAADQWTYSVSVHERGFVCGELHASSIRVRNRATLEAMLTVAGHTAAGFGNFLR